MNNRVLKFKEPLSEEDAGKRLDDGDEFFLI